MNLIMRPGPAAGLVEDAIADAEGRGLVGACPRRRPVGMGGARRCGA